MFGAHRQVLNVTLSLVTCHVLAALALHSGKEKRRVAMRETTSCDERNDVTLKSKVRRYEDSDEELIEVTQTRIMGTGF